MRPYREAFEAIGAALEPAARAVYGERLVAAALFGSVARGTMRPDSDLDLFLVVAPLPADRAARTAEFDRLEARLAAPLAAARAAGVHTVLSPVIKTPDELRAGSLLHLDLTDQARILYDPRGELRGYLDELAARLRALGARRVYRGGGYYWLLQPDYRWGDRIEPGPPTSSRAASSAAPKSAWWPCAPCSRPRRTPTWSAKPRSSWRSR